MSRLRFCLLLAVICSCSHLGNAVTTPETLIIPVDPIQKVTPVIPDTTTVPPDTTTTPKTTTTSTTTPSTTTPSTTTSSTTPSTTTSSTTTTTTTPPPPPPAPTPTPAPAPSPLPPPEQGTWSYTDAKSNVTCVIVQFAAQLNVTYTKTVENATSLWYVLINVPANATVVDGNCTGDQWLQLAWSNPNVVAANTLTVVYQKNDTTKNYEVKSLNVTLTPDNFVNGSSTEPIQLFHGPEWQTPLSTSYRCKVPTQLNMSSESASVVATLTLSRLQEEAYRTTPGNGFSAARECGGGDVPDAVPIAVGCALGGLVVVVLVAYFVGRRRSVAGYLSM